MELANTQPKTAPAGQAAGEKHECWARVYYGVQDYRCSRLGKYLESGRYWCYQHAPSRVAQRRETWEQKWKREREEKAEVQAQQAEQYRRADAFPALLEAAKRVLEFYTETRWVPDCDLADLRDAIAAAMKKQ